MAFSCAGLLLGGDEAVPYLCLSPDQHKVVQMYLLLEMIFGPDMGQLSNEVLAYVNNWMSTHKSDVAEAATTAMLAAGADDARSANELWAAAQTLKLHCWPKNVRDAFMVIMTCYAVNEQPN